MLRREILREVYVTYCNHSRNNFMTMCTESEVSPTKGKTRQKCKSPGTNFHVF